MMRLVCALVVVLAVARPLCAQETPRTLQKISAHVYAYVGVTNASPGGNSFGANCGVIVGDDAVMVVDTLVSAKEAARLDADIRKVTDKPVKYVVNTHYHLDHAWGNSYFANKGAVIIAHANARTAAPRSEYAFAHIAEFGMTQADLEGTVFTLPPVTFDDRLRVDLGGDVAVELTNPGPSHTDGSITVFVPGDKVLFAGDILFTRYHPNVVEGDIPHWIAVLAELEKTPATIIVPGHGPLSTVADIRDMETYLKEFDARAQELCRDKKQEDAPAIARTIMSRLPDQGRTELPYMVESNLRRRYLPPAEPVSGGKK